MFFTFFTSFFTIFNMALVSESGLHNTCKESSNYILPGGGPSVCGGTRIFWGGQSVKGGDQFFFSGPKGGGPEFFPVGKGRGPEKIGDRPSQTDGPPSGKK